MYTYVCTRVYMCCMHIHVHVYLLFVDMCAHMYACTFAYLHVSVCTCIERERDKAQTYIPVYTFTDIRIGANTVRVCSVLQVDGSLYY